MSFSTLARGLIGQITSRFSVWTNQMNQNLRFLDSRFGGLKILEQFTTTASLPAVPYDGDSYVITSTKTVETWFADPGTWQTTQLYVPDIFFDVNQSKFYFYNGTNIVELLTASIPAPNYTISTSCGNFATVSDIPQNVNNLDVTITTSGNPIDVYLILDGSTLESFFGLSSNGNNVNQIKGYIELLRDGSVIQTVTLWLHVAKQPDGLDYYIPAVLNFKDEQVSGTYNYKLRAYIDSAVGADQTISVSNVKLVAEEKR